MGGGRNRGDNGGYFGVVDGGLDQGDWNVFCGKIIYN